MPPTSGPRPHHAPASRPRATSNLVWGAIAFSGTACLLGVPLVVLAMKGDFDPVLRRLAALQPTGIAAPPPTSTPVTLPRAWTPTATRQSPIAVPAGTATPFMPIGSVPSQELIDAAQEKMYDGDHPEAVLAWDTILRQWPEYAAWTLLAGVLLLCIDP